MTTPERGIAAIGVDTVEVARIAAALHHPDRGDRFRARLFTAGERAYCDRRRRAAESYAARFAAKEAVIKALGGFVPPLDIEVVRDDGAPRIRLHGAAAQRAASLGIARWHLSLTHTASVATAFVVAERASPLDSGPLR